jgi:hypothetical protein
LAASNDMSLASDLAASDAADIAQVILQLRQALVELLDVIELLVTKQQGGLPRRLDTSDFGTKDEAAWKNARRLVADLDAGELLWPGWKRGRS